MIPRRTMSDLADAAFLCHHDWRTFGRPSLQGSKTGEPTLCGERMSVLYTGRGPSDDRHIQDDLIQFYADLS